MKSVFFYLCITFTFGKTGSLEANNERQIPKPRGSGLHGVPQQIPVVFCKEEIMYVVELVVTLAPFKMSLELAESCAGSD